MHCTNYIPLYCHVRDLNGGSGGFSWPLLNGNGKYVEEKGHKLPLPLSMDHCVGYDDKGVMRRIIQNHESTFRHQVQELHILYRRQRELMDEMKPRQNFPPHLLLQASEPSYSLSRTWPNLTQVTPHEMSWLRGFHSHDKLLEETTRNTSQPPTYSLDECFRERIYRSSQSDENGKRMLDLKLPFGVCHDKEEKIFEEGNLSYAVSRHKRPVTTDPSVNDSNICSFKTGNLSCKRTEFSIDLNEPMQIEEVHSSAIGPSDLNICLMEMMYNDQPESVVAGKTGFVNSGGTSSNLNLPMAIDLNSMPVSCFHEIETTPASLQNRETSAFLGCSSAHDHSLWKQKLGEEASFVDAKNAYKFLKIETDNIDLNPIGKSSPEKPNSVGPITFAEDADLIFPVSPQNKEGSPPRGESEDIRLEMPSLSPEQGLVEFEIFAAQTLVMISSSVVQEHPGNVGNSLHWFAQIVASAADDAAEIDQSELLSGVICDFTARTRKLSGKNPPNHPHTVKEEKETCPFIMPKKGPATGKRLCNNSRIALQTVDALIEPQASKRNKRMRACSTEMVMNLMSSTLKHLRKRSKQSMVNSWGRTRKREGGYRRRRQGKFLQLSLVFGLK